MSQNMIALKRQLMQSKLSVLMPSIKFVNNSQVGGHRGRAEISLGGAAPRNCPCFLFFIFL